jgi:phosphoglycerate dehydrogenase-like enzyme
MFSNDRSIKLLTTIKQLRRSGLADDLNVEIIHADSSAELLDLMSGSDVLAHDEFNKDMARQAGSLKLIHTSGAGYDRIEFAAVPRGVFVCNNFEHENAVAEWVLMAMIAQDRQVMKADRTLRAGSWEMGARHGAVYPGLQGQMVGVIGFGRIGRRVIELARTFQMLTIVATRSPLSDDERTKRGIDFAVSMHQLDKLFAESDFVVPCLPLSSDTKGLINNKAISSMKPTAHVINIARAEIIDEAALYTALRDHRIAGAALDVWWNEPTSPGSSPKPSVFPFEALSNVLMSPHASAVTRSMVKARLRFFSDQLRRLARGEELRNVVHIGE